MPIKRKGIKAVTDVFKLNDFIVFAFISAVGEIIGTAVNFWIPTYMTEYLNMPSKTVNSLFSIIAFTGFLHRL